MVKSKVGIKFDTKFLNDLTRGTNSGVEIQSMKHHLSLHPVQLNDFNKSVKDLLNIGIPKYNKNLDGILLGYRNIKLLSNMGVINNDSPFIHYDFLIDFFVFKPNIGREMGGTVNRKSKDHVGLLVYNAFNVSIPKPRDEDDWLGNSVNMGYEVLFRITFIDFSSYLPYIKGELMSIISAIDDGTTINNSKTKNKKIIFDDEDAMEESTSKKRKLDPNVEDEPKLKKSKKKKDKQKDKEKNDISLDEFNLLEIFNDSNNEEELKTKYVEKKKLKKKKDINI